MATPQELLQMALGAGVKFPDLPPNLQAAVASGRMDEATARQRALANRPQYRAAMGLPPAGPTVTPADVSSGASPDSGAGLSSMNGGGLQGRARPRGPRVVGGPGAFPEGSQPGRGGASLQGTPPPGMDVGVDPTPPGGPFTAGGLTVPGQSGGGAPSAPATKEGQPTAPTGFVPRMRPTALPADGSGTATPGIGGSVGGDTKMPEGQPPAAQPKPQLSDLAAVTAGVPPAGVPPARRRPPIQRPTNRGVYAF